MEAKIVVGLGFGDEGKGLTTDWLCSQAKNPLVIRFSGGQQCGHTVMIGSKKHIHANFGSGTLRGVPSYFSEHCSFYMNTLVEEHRQLKEKGVSPELYINPLAMVTTPWDVEWGRARERRCAHGSCGLGIGATQMRHNERHLKLFAADLLYPSVFYQKIKTIWNEYDDNVRKEPVNQGIIDHFMDTSVEYQKYFQVIKYEDLWDYQDATLIFEGSQGILLDKDHGIFPNVTYANTTSKNALEIIRRLGLKYPEFFYVTRCYQTRHGNGWMSNSDEIKLINNYEETCTENEWQGKFRVGELDYSLLNYALDIDQAHNPTRQTVQANMVVTCMDQRLDFAFEEDKIDHNLTFHYSYSPQGEGLIGRKRAEITT